MTDKKIARLYKTMQLIRKVEELIVDVYFTDVVKSPVHLSIGQEFTAAAVCDVLNDEDIVSNTYRCHGTHIAKGGDLNKMMAELYGKKDGCAGGKAGSMHLIEMEKNILGASAVVGTTIPVAAGYAQAMKWEKNKTGKQRVTVAFFGDGSTEEGCFSETINFAALNKLPILFFCENNRLAIHSKLEQRWSTDRICDRIETYGVKTYKITSGDILELHDIVTEAVEYIRQGKGPVFIECDCYRWMEHVGPGADLDAPYRDIKECNEWKNNDQLERLGSMLDPKIRKEIDTQIEKDIAKAKEFAENSPFPGREDLLTNVYAA
ncbi:thiamine pyrophosphate-dependent dehydrogenase E1 component subunit alpha [Rickettsiales bacterium]|nr:thiamine pyrophosphate-dependent dehydrogenase E1 component subunit alpha [Rickettsiales bacterium]